MAIDMSALTRRCFTSEEYHLMAEAGILGEKEPVELIEGQIVEMARLSRRHTSVVDRTSRLLVTQFSGGAIVRVRGAVRLSRFNEPQPDFALLRFRSDSMPRPGRRRMTSCSSLK